MINYENRAGVGRFDFVHLYLLIALLVCTGCRTNNQYATMPPDRESVPASEVLQISRELERPKFAGIVSAIDYHAGDYPIRPTESHKRFSDNLLKEYLDNFETVGNLVRENKVSQNRAYEELGYEIAKAWCNKDVQNYVLDARKDDKKASNAINRYSAFEEFAKYCLFKDDKTCADMDKGQIIEQQ